MKALELIGKDVVLLTREVVGKITNLVIDIDKLQISTLEITLNEIATNKMKITGPFLSDPKFVYPANKISSMKETVIIDTDFKELAYVIKEQNKAKNSFS